MCVYDDDHRQLADELHCIDIDGLYTVVSVLKDGPLERTELVTAPDARRYIRKYLPGGTMTGDIYFSGDDVKKIVYTPNSITSKESDLIAWVAA